jgi:hypothetical protein
MTLPVSMVDGFFPTLLCTRKTFAAFKRLERTVTPGSIISFLFYHAPWPSQLANELSARSYPD